MPYIHQSEAWGRSIFPPAPVINGVQVLPLCLGHLVALNLVGVFERFASLETVGGAVVEGIAICSQPFEDIIFKINSGKWGEDVKEVGKVLFDGDVDDVIKAFQDYLEDSQEVPQYMTQSKSNGSSGADWLMSMKLFLQSELHLSEYEIMNRPMAQCIAEHYAIAERNGMLTLTSQERSDQHKHAMENADEIIESIKKAGLLNG
jgi:hypothetical protein